MGTNYNHLSCEDRALIQLSLEQSCTLRVFARSWQRAPSTISRQLKRNGWTSPTKGPQKHDRPLLAGGYRSPLAQHSAVGWRERHDTHCVWPKMAHCGATSHNCCAIGISWIRSRAYCTECSRTTRRYRSARRPAKPFFTP